MRKWSSLLALLIFVATLVGSFSIDVQSAKAGGSRLPLIDAADRTRLIMSNVARRSFEVAGRIPEHNIAVLYRRGSEGSERSARHILRILPSIVNLIAPYYVDRFEGGGPDGVHEIYVEDEDLLSAIGVAGVLIPYGRAFEGPSATVVASGNYGPRSRSRGVLAHELTHAGQLSLIGSGRQVDTSWLLEGLAVMNEHAVTPNFENQERFDTAFLDHPERVLGESVIDDREINFRYGSYNFFEWLRAHLGVDEFKRFVHRAFERLHDARVENRDLSHTDAVEQALVDQGQELGRLLIRFRLDAYVHSEAVRVGVRRTGDDAFREWTSNAAFGVQRRGARYYVVRVPAGARTVRFNINPLLPGVRLIVGTDGHVYDWSSNSGSALFRIPDDGDSESIRRRVPTVSRDTRELVFVITNTQAPRFPFVSRATVEFGSESPEQLLNEGRRYFNVPDEEIPSGAGGVGGTGSAPTATTPAVETTPSTTTSTPPATTADPSRTTTVVRGRRQNGLDAERPRPRERDEHPTEQQRRRENREDSHRTDRRENRERERRRTERRQQRHRIRERRERENDQTHDGHRITREDRSRLRRIIETEPCLKDRVGLPSWVWAVAAGAGGAVLAANIFADVVALPTTTLTGAALTDFLAAHGLRTAAVAGATGTGVVDALGRPVLAADGNPVQMRVTFPDYADEGHGPGGMPISPPGDQSAGLFDSSGSRLPEVPQFRGPAPTGQSYGVLPPNHSPAQITLTSFQDGVSQGSITLEQAGLRYMGGELYWEQDGRWINVHGRTMLEEILHDAVQEAEDKLINNLPGSELEQLLNQARSSSPLLGSCECNQRGATNVAALSEFSVLGMRAFFGRAGGSRRSGSSDSSSSSACNARCPLRLTDAVRIPRVDPTYQDIMSHPCYRCPANSASMAIDPAVGTTPADVQTSDTLWHGQAPRMRRGHPMTYSEIDAMYFDGMMYATCIYQALGSEGRGGQPFSPGQCARHDYVGRCPSDPNWGQPSNS